jgi:hypothetical protein
LDPDLRERWCIHKLCVITTRHKKRASRARRRERLFILKRTSTRNTSQYVRMTSTLHCSHANQSALKTMRLHRKFGEPISC